MIQLAVVWAHMTQAVKASSILARKQHSQVKAVGEEIDRLDIYERRRLQFRYDAVYLVRQQDSD
jgi:hypothetical protein